MSEETDYFHQAIKRGKLTLHCVDEDTARRERARLYYFRRTAALTDPRALAVKLSLVGTEVRFTFLPSSVESIS